MKEQVVVRTFPTAKEKENIQETIQHLGELCYDNGITENDIWNFIRDKKSKEDFLWTD